MRTKRLDASQSGHSADGQGMAGHAVWEGVVRLLAGPEDVEDPDIPVVLVDVEPDDAGA